MSPSTSLTPQGGPKSVQNSSTSKPQTPLVAAQDIAVIEANSKDFLRCLEVSPDGKHLAVGTELGQVRVYEVAAARHVQDTSSHEEAVSVVKWSPDGACVAASTARGPVRVWRMATGASITLQGRADIAWSPDGSTLSAAIDNYTCGIWRMSTGVLEHQFKCKTDDTHILHWAKDGTLQAVGRHKHGHIRETLWTESPRFLQKLLRRPLPFKEEKMSFQYFLAWNPASKSVAVRNKRSDEVAVVYFAQNSSEEETKRTIEGQYSSVSAVAWSVDGRYLAYATHNQTVMVWDCEQWEEVYVFNEEGHVPRAVAWSPSGQHLFYECGKKVKVRGIALPK